MSDKCAGHSNGPLMALTAETGLKIGRSCLLESNIQFKHRSAIKCYPQKYDVKQRHSKFRYRHFFSGSGYEILWISMGFPETTIYIIQIKVASSEKKIHKLLKNISILYFSEI